MRWQLQISLDPVYLFLFALLLPIAFVASVLPSRGVPVLITPAVPDCHRPIVSTIQSDDSTSINSGPPVTADQAASEIHRLFQARLERFVHVIAEPEVTVAQLVSGIEVVRAKHCQAVLLTSKFLKEIRIVGMPFPGGWSAFTSLFRIGRLSDRC